MYKCAFLKTFSYELSLSNYPTYYKLFKSFKPIWVIYSSNWMCVKLGYQACFRFCWHNLFFFLFGSHQFILNRCFYYCFSNQRHIHFQNYLVTQAFCYLGLLFTLTNRHIWAQLKELIRLPSCYKFFVNHLGSFTHVTECVPILDATPNSGSVDMVGFFNLEATSLSSTHVSGIVQLLIGSFLSKIT